MSRTFLTFGDIAGKLHMLQIECTRCARKGRYSVAKLLVEHGHRGNMSKWVSDLRGDCPKRNAAHLNERCDLICCPTLGAAASKSSNPLSVSEFVGFTSTATLEARGTSS
jgi:hypothetical protein